MIKNIESYIIQLYVNIDNVNLKCINCHKLMLKTDKKTLTPINEILKKQIHTFSDKGVTFKCTTCENCGCNTFDIFAKIVLDGMDKGEEFHEES